MTTVAVITPTLRRPESLERALLSLFAQTGLAGHEVRVIVVDNDPAGTAEPVVAALHARSPWPLDRVHEPRPGVAFARNAGVAATDADLIAFLDDDEAASPGWLSALVDVQAATGADVVFGPIQGRAGDAEPWLRPYLDRFFGRESPIASGVIDRSYGCGNSLMVRRTALPGPEPFDLAANDAGGEDDALFARLKTQGCRFAWAADAWVDEFAPPHRATLRYALGRAFAYGQGPSQTAAARRDWPGVARWMLIGLAQASVWGTASAILALLRHPRRADVYDRAVRGLGKVLWMGRFDHTVYGQRELRRLEAEAATVSR